MFFLNLFLIGACFGSFLCLVAERLPVGRSLWWPPSHCQGCHQPLQLYELIPVVSILLQRFRCRKCQQPVAKSYLLAELVMGSLTASCFSAGLTIDALILWWWLTSAFTLSLAESGGSAFVLLTDWSFLFLFFPSRLTLFSGSHGARGSFVTGFVGLFFTGTSVADATIFCQ